MALVEVVYGYGLRALAGAARVGKVYFRPHGAGVTIGVFQRIPAAFAKHARQIFRSTRAGKKWMAAIQDGPTVHNMAKKSARRLTCSATRQGRRGR